MQTNISHILLRDTFRNGSLWDRAVPHYNGMAELQWFCQTTLKELINIEQTRCSYPSSLWGFARMEVTVMRQMNGIGFTVGNIDHGLAAGLDQATLTESISEVSMIVKVANAVLESIKSTYERHKYMYPFYT